MQYVQDCVKKAKDLKVIMYIPWKNTNLSCSIFTVKGTMAVTQQYMHLKHAADMANKKKEESTLHRSQNSYMF